MKTTIKSIAHNIVQISYECAGDVVTKEFSAPREGGYVREANGSQVCDKLMTRGSTLLWSGDAPLVNLIRREYRAMRASEKRENT